MKTVKIIIGFCGLFFCASLNLFAQGRINFSNSSQTPLRISNGNITQVLGPGSTATFGIGPASVRVQLFAGLNSNMLSPVLVGTCSCLSSVTNTASTVAGFQGLFAGGTGLSLPGYDGTQPVFLRFTATSLDGNYYAASSIILVNVATGAAPATVLFSATPTNQWNGLTIGLPPFLPWITTQPQSQVVAVGGNFTLNVGVAAADPLYYQWLHSGTNIVGATNSSYNVIGVTTADAGQYKVYITNVHTQPLESAIVTVTVTAPLQFSAQPESQIVPLWGTASFSAVVTGSPAPHYQWWFNGNVIPEAVSNSLIVTNVGTNQLGDYTVVASNGYSAVTSSVAGLYMSPSLRNPFTGTVAIWGREATLGVFAQGSGDLNYQWFKDGLLVSDATNATLVFPSVQIADGGLYHVVVSSALGSVTNPPAQLVINPANTSLGFYAGIRIDGVVGYTYGIEFSTNLTDLNAWTALTNVTLTQPVQLWIDTSVESRGPGNNGRYYRVTAQ